MTKRNQERHYGKGEGKRKGREQIIIQTLTFITVCLIAHHIYIIIFMQQQSSSYLFHLLIVLTIFYIFQHDYYQVSQRASVVHLLTY